MTPAQKNLSGDLYEAIRDGINQSIADSITRLGPNEAKALLMAREMLACYVHDRLRARFRIGRQRRKQTELNP